ncbi:MAG TPA: hypothetical protein VIN05_10465 [Roseovarius sp.]
MYGVVLWTDQRENRAVIWCEDHGDLAFYRGASGGDAAMAAGDLVEFDLRDAGDMRLADMPRLVTRRSHPTLSAELKKAGTRMGAIRGEAPVPANNGRPADIIPFKQVREAAYA